MLCARCKVAIAYAPLDGNWPSYLVAVYRVGEASAVHVFVSPRKSCNSTMVAGVVAVAPSVITSKLIPKPRPVARTLKAWPG